MNLDILKEVAQLLNQTDKDVLSAKLDLNFSGIKTLGDEIETIEGEGFKITDKKRSRGDQWALFSIFNMNTENEVYNQYRLCNYTPW